MIRKEKVLITGGSGFLGRNVFMLFKSNGYDVSSCSRKENVDIIDFESILYFIKQVQPEIIINCAAHVGGLAYSGKYPVGIFEDNLQIVFNLIKAANRTGIEKFVNVIPNCSYPGDLEEYEESRWWDGPMHETVVVYGLPRKISWGHCYAYHKINPRFKPIHLILPNMYGPYDHFDPVRSHALGALISKIVSAKQEAKKTIEVWGTGKPVREWLYVEDGAMAILKSIEKFGRFKPNEIMNIGIRKGVSIRDLAYIIKEIVGWQGELIFDTSKPDGAMKKVLIADKMKSILQWQPTTDLRAGIKKTVDWYLKNLIKIG